MRACSGTAGESARAVATRTARASLACTRGRLRGVFHAHTVMNSARV